MRPDAPPRPGLETASPGGGWTLILADVVALMLAFFVLTFSMREQVDGERGASAGRSIDSGSLVAGAAAGGSAIDPVAGHPLAIAAEAGRAADPLRQPELAVADAPTLAYLAAIVQGMADLPSPLRVWHDDTMLVVDLPRLPDDGDGPLGAVARQPLLTMAFLARRFDLTFALTIPADGLPGLADRAALALGLRDWLAGAAGVTAPEVTFGATDAAMTPAGRPAHARLALLVKPADGRGSGPPSR